MIQSQAFTSDLLLHYLEKKYNDKEIRKLLIEKQSTQPITDVEHLLPHLCFLAQTKPFYELHYFLNDMCAESLLHFTKIHTYVEAFGMELVALETDMAEVFESLVENQEISMVNSKNHMDRHTKNDKNKKINKNPEEIMEQAMDKKIRSDYKDDFRHFYEAQTKPCYKQKQIAEEKRKETLQKHLQKINVWLYERRITRDGDTKLGRNLRQGILVPFEKDTESNMIVRVCHEEFHIYNTQERSPYMFAIETIDPRELETKKPNLNKDHFYEKIYYTKISEDNSGQLTPKTIKKPEFNIKSSSVNKPKYEEEITNDESRNLQNHCEPILSSTNKGSQKEILEKSDQQASLNAKLDTEPKGNNMINNVCTKVKEKFSNFKRKNVVRTRSAHNIGNKNNKALINNEQWLLSTIKFYSECIQPNIKKIKSSTLKNLLWEYYEELNNQKLQLKKKLTKKKLESKSKEKKTDSESLAVFSTWGSNWAHKSKILRKNSPHSNFESLRIRAFVCKADDDMRQEMLALNLIGQFNKIFESEETGIKIKSYSINLTGQNSGWIDYLADTISIDAMKKKYKNESLSHIYKKVYAVRFEEAQKNFVESLAGGCQISYLLSIKDRHNGNQLVDKKGHICHIDFGFILGMSPGNINFEGVPFKLTEEYMDLMGGMNSNLFMYFKIQQNRGFSVQRKYLDTFCDILNVYKTRSSLKCFTNFDIAEFRNNFGMCLTDHERAELVDNQIYQSFRSTWTTLYDEYQKYKNNIDY